MRDTQKVLRAYRSRRIVRGTHKGVGMVRLPALITEYARLDGRPRSTIAWYARLAREAGKLPTTKRGRGAAEMGVREAVNLILACNCAEDPKEGANVIKKYRSYEVYAEAIGSKSDWELQKEIDEIENSDIREIALEPNLGKALEKLIYLTPSLFKTLYKKMQHFEPEKSDKEIFTKVVMTHNISLSINEHDVHLILKEHALSVILDRLEKNSIDIMYTDDLDKQIEKRYFREPGTKFRHVETTLGFGVFLGLAKLFFEDSMQFPGELIPQSEDEAGDG
jgi:hypothetical protein